MGILQVVNDMNERKMLFQFSFISLFLFAIAMITVGIFYVDRAWSIVFFLSSFLCVAGMIFIYFLHRMQENQTKEIIVHHSLLLFQILSETIAKIKSDASDEEQFYFHYFETLAHHFYGILAVLYGIHSDHFFKKKMKKDWKRYIDHIAECYTYILELHHDLNVRLNKEYFSSSHPLSIHLHSDVSSVEDYMKESMVFLNDYLDLMLYDAYPFFPSSMKKRYWKIVHYFQEKTE